MGLRGRRGPHLGDAAHLGALTDPPTQPGGRPGPRLATLVLVRADERPLGVLPAFEVAVPWWQEAAPVVAGARERFGIEVTVLRLLEARGQSNGGGAVTYLVEVGAGADIAALPLEPWTTPPAGDPLTDDPRRLPWARPGGPAADLAWADEVLAGHGLARRGPARQVRTWNLSSLWTLPLTDGTTAWLKVVPPFFAHEGAVLGRLAGERVPALLGTAGSRILMPELAGEDQYDATRPRLDRMIDVLVDLQADRSTTVDALLALGLPDWRGPALGAAIRTLVERRGPDLDPRDRAVLEAFVRDLPERFAAIAACGLPDTLVHGDFHPGNVRAHDDELVILDWGDCGVGHPLLDEAAFLDVRPDDADDLRAVWHARWRERVPGSDPDRASRLLRPIAAARQARIFQGFLDGIEPSEHVYHRGDVPRWLARTADLVREGG